LNRYKKCDMFCSGDVYYLANSWCSATMARDISVNFEVLNELFRRETETYLQEYLGSGDSENSEFKHSLTADEPIKLSVMSRDERWNSTFYLEVLPQIFPSGLQQLVDRLRRETEKNEMPLLAVPKLSKASRHNLRAMKFPYIDLAGGFYLPLAVPGRDITIVVDGEKSYNAERWLRSEPPDLPGVSQGRIAIYRTLLAHKGETWGVRELSRHTGLNASTVSRYLREAVNAGWVERRGRSEHILADPAALLDYWAGMTKRMGSGFAFYKLIVKDYSELRKLVADYLKNEKDAYHTLWSGAEFYGHFQEQPVVALYLPEPRKMRDFFERSGYVPPFNLQYSLLVGPTRDEKISNLWLIRTPDKAIGSGALEKDGERAVCWQQVYVDLSNAPRRGKSIAVMLREQMENLDAG
jgi:DNA-binding transcriptional ArsR family regulator